MIETPPGWLPHNKTTVDPQLKTDLSEIKEHPPTQLEYMPKIVEKLKYQSYFYTNLNVTNSAS